MIFFTSHTYFSKKSFIRSALLNTHYIHILSPNFSLLNFEIQDFNIFGVNGLHFGSLYIFAYFQIKIFNHLPYIPINIWSTPHFSPILQICTPISVQEAYYFHFPIYPFSSNSFILSFYLMMIILLYFKTNNSVISHLGLNQSEKCKYGDRTLHPRAVPPGAFPPGHFPPWTIGWSVLGGFKKKSEIQYCLVIKSWSTLQRNKPWIFFTLG